MSGQEPDDASEAIRQAKELLGQATLLRLRGDREGALAKCQESLALRLDWEAYELLGDIQLERESPEEAMKAYREGLTINPGRARLEEKVGVAAIAQARRAALRQRALDLAEGRLQKEQPRKPAAAALLSLLFPGLGQFYNRDLLKGAALLGLALLLDCGIFLTALQNLAALRQVGGGISLFSLFQGGALILFVLRLPIWAYAVADAAIQASKSMTSDDTGLI